MLHFRSLVERIVKVLSSMKCPFTLEPHQIQGLDFINIFSVTQWLVKESVNLRNEKAERLKLFSIGQFHNHFNLVSSEHNKMERYNILHKVKRIEDLYSAKRQFKRKPNIEHEDESSQVKLTLLEYGIKKLGKSIIKSSDKSDSSDNEMEYDEV